MIVDFPVLRRKMVDSQVRTTDVTDHRVLAAMLDVPRERFVPPARAPLAYLDEDVPLSGRGESARFLMEPSPFARLLQLAAVQPGERVLEVGAGTGYGAAVLAHMGARVVALECEPALASAARAALAGEMDAGAVAVAEGPLAQGAPQAAPFDAIILGGAVEEVPAALLAQLAPAGRLVAVVGTGLSGRATLFVQEDGAARERPVAGRLAFNCAVRPLPGFARAPAFQF